MINKTNNIRWLIFAAIGFLIFVMLQVPAAWLITKFYKNNQMLHNVSGNIWHGQADWTRGNLKGSLNWNTRPWDLILLRLGANVEIHSGNTKLQGVMGYGFGKSISIKNLEGQIAPETLKSFADWQWPMNAIQLKDVQFKYKPQQGFSRSSGEIQWAGGDLSFSFAQRQESMNVPAMLAQLKDDNGKLSIDVRDQREQKMMNLSIEPDLMLDVQLTQRFLMNVASYEGKAGLDTYVISSRQPLLSGVN